MRAVVRRELSSASSRAADSQRAVLAVAFLMLLEVARLRFL
jgi:hypothetical protein